jgi:hypothetical protein
VTELLNPEERIFKGKDGKARKYILGDIPYLAGGREIATQFMTTGAPKIGDYNANENLAVKMFSYVKAIDDHGNEFLLDNISMVNNHVPDFLTGIQIEEAMLEKCVGFSVVGKLREYQAAWKESLPELITTILTQLQPYLQTQGKQPTKSLKKATAQKK